MSDEDKTQVWFLWRAGESISSIARSRSKPPGSIYTVLKHHGGIAPALRRPRPSHLSVNERELISRGLSAGESLRAIACKVHRPVSTVSREVHRNGGRESYRAVAAQQRALEQLRRPKLSALQADPVLCAVVIDLLGQEWSPEQIVGRLRLLHPEDPAMRISHESIYRAIYTTRWNVIPQHMCRKLRTRRPIRKNKKNTVKGQWRSQIINARPIEDRPAVAEGRSALGHQEGDLIIGAKASQVATLVDRKSRFLTMVKLQSRHTAAVIPALTEAYARMDTRLHGTLTWDRGMELAGHAELAQAAHIDVFFAAPRSPWQRGTNENTNKLMDWSPNVGLLIERYAVAGLWARYSSGLR
ncbi:IS30 family transposase [Nesterenkonia sp. AN1]|uniref:IS30 family transposase n=1 Tax=Nesterenkonia sp. AN1 TaxID=652017 RepID=UPI0006841755|nr:IS30 family transposase [Nesterenkonia sp. AN1]